MLTFLRVFIPYAHACWQTHKAMHVYTIVVFTIIQSCSYDHVELNFFLNGQSLHCPVTGIKGTVYPVLYGEFLCV